jgi:phosphatidylglycerophosphatase A
MESGESTGTTRTWTHKLIIAFTSVFFLGYAPVASGTVGSLPAIAVAFLLRQQPLLLLLLAVVLLVFGVVASSQAAGIYGRKDPGEVVIDEFVGMLLAFLWLPMTWVSVPIVFVLFRIFDIWKPFPARQCDRMEGGLGIMLDDIVAGIYANLAFRIILLFL